MICCVSDIISMSPPGRLKQHPQTTRPHPRASCMNWCCLLVLILATESASHSIATERPPYTSTPGNQVDYLENGVDPVFEAGKDKRESLLGEGKDKVSTYCTGFESKCKCSPDGKEIVCKRAGFVEVPSKLPSTLTKL